MTIAYARGARSLGICDRCGFRFLLNTLKAESVRGIKMNQRVCDSCYDPDHPQNFQGMKPIYDPQALRMPRPDIKEVPIGSWGADAWGEGTWSTPLYTPPIIG